MIPNIIAAGWKWIERETDLLWPASLEIVFAATLLLVIALVMHLALGRAAASLRHRIWALTMGALLLLPLLCPILPKLPLPLNISLAENRLVASRPAMLTPERSGESAIAQPPAKKWTDSEVHPTPYALPVDSSPTAASPLPQPSSALPAEIPATAPATKPSIESSRSLLARCNYAFILIWALGTLLYLLAMARWLWLERRLAKNASEVDDPSWQALLEELKLQFGIRWAVALGVSQESEVPLAVGWRRPKILLPVDCRCWAAEKRRVVLAHELSHVARHDVFWQVVARLACAVYWFHPLAWLAERRMRVERELACDDAVLRSGSQPDQYAAVLLDMAAAVGRRPRVRAAAIAMACRHPIQRRIRAILQPGLNRLPVGPRMGRLLLAGTLLLVVLAGGLHPFAPPQVKAEPRNATVARTKSSAVFAATKLEKPGDTSKPAASNANPKGSATPAASSPAPPAASLPRRTHLFNDKYSAVAVQTENDVNFVLVYRGFLSTGMEDWYTDKAWGFDGNVYLVDEQKTRVAKKNVDKRKFAVKYTSSAPRTLFLDGKAYDLSQGRIFILRDEGEPVQTNRTMPLRDEKDLVAIGDFAEAYAGKLQPKSEEAQSLIKKWQEGARMNGNIPGGALGPLVGAVTNFVKSNPTDRHTPKFAELLKRIDTSRDWTPTEAVALLDDVTGIDRQMPECVELFGLTQAMQDSQFFSLGGAVKTGQPLPAELANAPWGNAQQNGLRTAWLLEPRAKEYRLGTPLKSRILFQNAGRNVVVFRALTWNQSNAHKARDAKGAEIGVSSVYWLTRPVILACRLAPGEYTEVTGAGIGVGSQNDAKEAQNIRVGFWVNAKEGDEVTFTPAPVSVNGKTRPDAVADWWLAFIKDRLSLDAPLPAAAAERRRILDRAMRDLFGTAPTSEETAEFVADRRPDALDALTKRLANRTGVSSFSGTLQSGVTKFRVVRAESGAVKAESSPSAVGTCEVKGNVIDENGKPLPGAEVWLPLFIPGDRRIETLRTKSDDQGRFVLEVKVDWLAKLQQRSRTLWAYAAGHQLGTGNVVLSTSASNQTIRLGPATDTSFVVTDPDGRPCAGALVEPFYIRTRIALQFPPDELLARAGACTDAEGRVKLPAVPPDLLYQVRVHAKGFGTQVQPTTPAAAIVASAIRLRPVGKIEGRVVGGPPELVRGVTLVFTSSVNDRPRPFPLKVWPIDGYAEVKTDKQGRFTVPAIAVGDAGIWAVVDEKQPLRLKLPESVRVQADRTTSFEIPLVPSVIVRGTVRVKDTGKPVPGAEIDIRFGVNRQRSTPVSDAQGNYTARVLPGRISLQVIDMPAPYVLLSEGAARATNDRSFEVPKDVKEFDLPPIEAGLAGLTKSIPGRVVDQQDRPVGNIQISVVEGDRQSGGGKSDKEGRFELAGVPVTINPGKAEYRWWPEVGPGKPFVSGMPSKCEVLKSDPLLLRALPRDPLMDMP